MKINVRLWHRTVLYRHAVAQPWCQKFVCGYRHQCEWYPHRRSCKGGVGIIAAHAINIDLHCAEGDMNSRAVHFDGDEGVQYTDSSLEWA